MILTGSKRFFHERRHTRSFLQSFKWFKAILTSYHISHKTFPTNQNHGLGPYNKGEKFWKLTRNDFDWLKTIFFMKEGIRDHFCKVSSDLKPFWQVTIFHTRLPHKPNHGLGLRQGWNSENLQKWFWLAQNDFFHERRHTRSFWQSFKWFKPFWQVTIFHTRLPHKPNHGLGLRQGWNSENLKKMSLNGSKRFFSWKKAYAIIFEKFQVISSHFDKLPYFTLDFPTNQSWIGTLNKGEILKTYKNDFDWLKTIFFMKEGIPRSFLQSFKWFKAILDKLP